MADAKPIRQRQWWEFNKGKGIDGPVAQSTIWIIMILTIFMVALPVTITVLNSLKTNYEAQLGVWTWPMTPKWGNWGLAMRGITKNLINSLIVATGSTLTGLLLSSIAAYVFVRHEFPAKNVLFIMVIALMIIPGVLTLTPSFLQMIEMRLKDSWWALYLPYVSGMQVGSIFLLRTFMSQHPKDLYEAAMIDGGNDFVMYTRICIPLSIPILAIQAVGTFGGFYNDYLWPTLVISKTDEQMLMPVLRAMTGQVSGINDEQGIKHAMYLLSGLPLIVTTALGLKYFINGDFAAGMKL